MKKYTVRVEYHRTYHQDITVFAVDVEAACELAIDEADDNGAWKSYDEMGPSYIGRIESNDDPNRTADNCCDVPDKFTEGVMLGFLEAE